MVLKLKNRQENPRKKVLIYGLDGTGKSTYAQTYCQENGLNPIVIDIDDTNFTNLDILDLKFSNDMQTYKILKDTIKEIGKTDYDTIIVDGVTSLLEMLTSKAKGMAAYSDRSKRWNDLLFELENTQKNIIFIGQIDLEMLFTEDYQPSKAVIKVNSLVNEKYFCYVDKDGKYGVDVKKFRTIDSVEEIQEASKPKTKPVQKEPEPVVEKVAEPTALDNPKEIALSIIAEIPKKTLANAYDELIRQYRKGFIPEDVCKEVRVELERLLG